MSFLYSFFAQISKFQIRLLTFRDIHIVKNHCSEYREIATKHSITITKRSNFYSFSMSFFYSFFAPVLRSNNSSVIQLCEIWDISPDSKFYRLFGDTCSWRACLIHIWYGELHENGQKWHFCVRLNKHVPKHKFCHRQSN